MEGVATRSSLPSVRALPPSLGGGRDDEGADGRVTSDTGLQRVVNKRENAFAAEAGTSFTYQYRSNPLSTNGLLARAIKSGVAEVGGFASASLGNYEVLNGVYTPRIGYNVSSVMLSKKALDFADYMTNRIAIAGDLKYESGWSITPSLEYSNIISSKFKTEDYKEWYPNLSVSKIWGINENSLVRAAATTGYHFSSVDSLGGVVPGVTADRLDNWTNSVGLAYYRNLFFGVVWQAYGELSNRSYYQGQNDGRTDLMKTVGSSLNYNWKFLRFSTFLNFTNRKSSDYLNDYKNLDAGATVSAAISF